MKNLILLNLCLVTALATGCGKKVQDLGPQFSLQAVDLKATEDGAPGSVIVRDDQNSGPKYHVTASDLSSIESIDKKLICGPLTIPAKRSLKVDSDFLTFSISETEFHGLNQLPLRPTCTLQVIATNGKGSTVTKNNPVALVFDKNPTLQVSRRYITAGYMRIPEEVVLEGYEISNPLPYGVQFSFKPMRSAAIWGQCSLSHWRIDLNNFPPRLGPASALPTRIQMEPPTVELSGDLLTGYRFNLKPGESVKITSLSQIPREWTSASPCAPISIGITGVSEPSTSILQSPDFEISSQNLPYAQGPTIQTSNRLPGIIDEPIYL